MQQQLAEGLQVKRSLWGRHQLRHAVQTSADLAFLGLQLLGQIEIPGGSGGSFCRAEGDNDRLSLRYGFRATMSAFIISCEYAVQRRAQALQCTVK